jgi:hypothetical protein
LERGEFCPELIFSSAPDVVLNQIPEPCVNPMDPDETLKVDALP